MKAIPLKIVDFEYKLCSPNEATHLKLKLPGPIPTRILPIMIGGDRKGTPNWTWNGSVDSPTLKPSVKTNNGTDVCHSWINDGKVKFLDDCTHEFANQTLDLLNAEFSDSFLIDDAPLMNPRTPEEQAAFEEAGLTIDEVLEFEEKLRLYGPENWVESDSNIANKSEKEYNCLSEEQLQRLENLRKLIPDNAKLGLFSDSKINRDVEISEEKLKQIVENPIIDC